MGLWSHYKMGLRSGILFRRPNVILVYLNIRTAEFMGRCASVRAWLRAGAIESLLPGLPGNFAAD